MSIESIGSYRNIKLSECIRRKVNLLLKDEAGLAYPLSVSLVIPVKVGVSAPTRSFEIRALKQVLSECSRLVDLGYLDEIILIDGSVDENGEIDYRVLQSAVDLAYNSLSLFRIQVDLIDEYFSERVKAKRGFFDFVVKFVHQFDKNIFRVLTTFDIDKITSFSEMPPGKGAALWLSIPMAVGDIICFVDSDIRNFRKGYVVALCDPIIRSWRSELPIKMVKAYYERFTYSFGTVAPHVWGRRFGGRVSRLFMRPLLKILSEEYPQVFGGLNTLEYPLSGEQSLRKDFIEKIRFPTNYAIEILILTQFKKFMDLLSIKQVDFDLLYHIGQTGRNLKNMITQITKGIINALEEAGIYMNERDKERILSSYMKEAEKMIPYYQRIFKKTREEVLHLFRGDVYHSEDIDAKRLKIFTKAFKEALATEDAITLLPSWEEIRGRANYFAMSQLLRRRCNQSTQSRLLESGLIVRD